MTDDPDETPAGLPADIPIHVQIGDAERQTVGTVGVVLTIGDPDTEDGTAEARPADPDDVGRQVAYVLECAAADLRRQHGHDPD